MVKSYNKSTSSDANCCSTIKAKQIPMMGSELGIQGKTTN
jgi:hypothetical protein